MIPLADLVTALRLGADYADEDGYLAGLEAAAVAHIQRSTGRYFGAPAARMEYHTTYGAPEIRLAEEPRVTEETPITITADGVTVDTADFEVRGRTIRNLSGWGASGGEVVITYTAGYAEGEEPADIRQAVTMLASHWFENRIPVAVGTVAPEVALTLRALLAPWKRYGV